MPKAASQWSGSPSIKGSSETTQMVLLALSVVGITFCWHLEATYCTPYLLSLGLSKSNTSLVFIAGPISGLLMQPVIGTITDRSTSRYGRRRPFMLGGAIVVGCCLFLLAWTKEAVAWFVSDEALVKDIALVVAIATIYVTDFAINVAQACSRSLIVDALSIAQQQTGTAWATRVGNVGGLASYLIGTLDLVSILPAWIGGDTQFKKMTLVSVLILWVSIGLTCWAVTERVLVSTPGHKTSIWGLLPSIWRRTFDLPPRISAICWVQFWSWIGWFPFLFYSSTWVGETYYRYEGKPNTGGDKHDTLGEVGRLGSLSLVLFSIVSTFGSVIFPSLVKSIDHGKGREERFTPRPPPSLPRTVQKVLFTLSRLPKPDLVTMWLWAHLSFSFIMLWAPFVKSLAAATLLVAACGVPWAIDCWAPFAEMGIEINRLATGDSANVRLAGDGALHNAGGYSAIQHRTDEEDDLELSTSTLGRARSTSILRVANPDVDDEDGSTGELAGVYLGVLNVYTTLPQFVGTFVSWVVFTIVEPDRSKFADDDPERHKWLATSGVSGISVCFFVGAISALGAAEAARRLRKLS